MVKLLCHALSPVFKFWNRSSGFQVWKLPTAVGSVHRNVDAAAMASADDPETQPYQIETWQVEDGLPQSSVTAIVQSHAGYLWLGTFNGLVRLTACGSKSSVRTLFRARPVAELFKYSPIMKEHFGLGRGGFAGSLRRGRV